MFCNRSGIALFVEEALPRMRARRLRKEREREEEYERDMRRVTVTPAKQKQSGRVYSFFLALYRAGKAFLFGIGRGVRAFFRGVFSVIAFLATMIHSAYKRYCPIVVKE